MLRYALTVFVSAFLLFQVQPLIGRFILPWFGGGPSIWTSCLLFFQAALLGGYLYAHLLCARLSLRYQAIVHLCVLGGSLVLLPIAPSDSWKPLADQAPLARILLLLIATVGGPYFVLASTGPLMQKWFSQTSPDRSPYRLYALSNIGSLLALLSYPFVFEPWLTLHTQVMLWTALYVVFVVSAGWCAVRLLRLAEQPERMPEHVPVEHQASSAAEQQVSKPGWVQVALWLVLSACGSAMLLATTNQLCIDVATVPFLWILPLSLYLVSFIICFDQPRWYDRRAFSVLLVVTVPLACWALSAGADLGLVKQVAIFSAALFACCMACHGELVQSRPDPRYLTLFYLLISAGGVLGGLFVAIVATNWFTGYWEFPISLVGCCVAVLAATCYQRVWRGTPSVAFWSWAGGAMVMTLSALALVWWPHTEAMSAVDEVGLLGGLAAWVLVGLIAMGMRTATRVPESSLEAVPETVPPTSGVTLEAKSPTWLWFGLAVPALVWVIGWGMWRTPEVMTTNLASVWAGVSLLGFGVAICVDWWLCRLSARQQGLWVRVLIVVYADVLLGWAYYRGWVTAWQCGGLLALGLVGVVAEWMVVRGQAKYRAKYRDGHRHGHRDSTGAGRLDGRLRTPGIWYWLPVAGLIGVAAYDLVKVTRTTSDEVVYQSRNFYGVLNVEYDQGWEGDEVPMPAQYQLTHGQIQHGFQYDDVYWRTQPTTYYGFRSGLGLAIGTMRWRSEVRSQGATNGIRVGVVGLGTGTIAAYGQTDDVLCFYEINPAVRDLSGRFFTYLQETPAEVEVKIGDARIVLERELQNGQRQQFDVLAIDAFSSDAIPVHLLTAQCGEIYREHVASDGILAIHISNRFLDLGPVVRGLAEHLGWRAVQIENEDDEASGVFNSSWVLLTPSTEVAEKLQESAEYVPWEADDEVLLWTDDYSGLWRILSF